ncbi:MAG: prephenate dehydrogenase [Nitrosomonadaceae bacterium]|nr:prephenate dehydrogenase [Nitrosomonadaceae bacterium]
MNKLVIVGVGLIGGSFALALREAGLVKHITGVGRSQTNMQRAVELGVIDEISTDIASALNGADLVFLAMPVGQTASTLEKITSSRSSATAPGWATSCWCSTLKPACWLSATSAPNSKPARWMPKSR